jgi:hypothetical protein
MVLILEIFFWIAIIGLIVYFIWLTINQNNRTSLRIGHRIALIFAIGAFILVQLDKFARLGHFGEAPLFGLFIGFLIPFYFPGGFVLSGIAWIIRKIAHIPEPRKSQPPSQDDNPS